jgi:hypothetical protein
MAEERKWPEFDFRLVRLVRDPESSTTKTGKEVVKALGAVNKSYDKGDDYLLGISAFGKNPMAALLASEKGDRLVLEGTYKTQESGGKTWHDFVPMSVYRAVQVEASDDL